MKKCYLTVICIDDINYIQLIESDKIDDSYALHAFTEKDYALKQFESFKRKALSSNYESHISGSIGIINLRPHIIEVEKDNPETLREYLIEDRPYKLKGNVFGGFVNMYGVKVKKEILKLSVCNVAKEYINEVYSAT